MKKIMMTLALMMAVVTVSAQDAKTGATPQHVQKKECVAKKGCCQEG